MSYDLLVIGGGAAGMAAARTAVRLKRSVLLVQDGPVGGDCTFTGCVPSKTLIESARDRVSFDQAMHAVRSTVAAIAATETADVLRAEGVHVLEGRARLTAPSTADVDGQVVSARRCVIATGSGPLLPPVPGLLEAPHLTSETVWQLRQAPESLLVLGGGAIGCELAQAFARFGVRVTLVEAGDRLLAKEEPEASAVVAEVLAREGVDVRLKATVAAVERAPGSAVQVRLADGTALQAAQLLVAVGRRPLTDGLGLDAAGVARDSRGFITVDDRLRTNLAGTYAVGDVTGRLQFTHAADEMGRTAALNALRPPLRLRFHMEAIPWVTFTAPEVARVGMTEQEAATVGGRVAYLPMAAVDRAVTAGRTDGFIKLVAGPRRLTGHLAGGRLLGATIVAERAGEMVHEVALAIRTGMFTGRLAQTVHAYPTWSTGVRSAAAQFVVEADGRRARAARTDASRAAG